MELKKGYKQTEAGVIPEDWEVKELHQIAKFINGKAHEMFIDESGDYKVVNSKFVSSEGSVFKSSSSPLCPLNIGDITMVMSDIPNGKALAKCFLIDKNNTYTLNQRICALTPFKDSPKYLFNTLNRNKYFLAFDSGTGQTNLRRQEVLSCPVILPPKSEQTAIATALSDADAYINSLEKLIEKKRQIKQGAMQELLKPKDGWAWKKLGDIGKTYGGLSGKSKDDFKDGVFPYIPFMNIMTNPVIDLEFLDFVNLKTGESQNSAQIGDLFFNGSSETPEEVGMCSILLDEVPNLYLNSFCFGYRLKKELNINGLYLTYYFRSKEGRKLFYSMAQGATRYNLSKSNFNKLQVPIPTIEEQNFIAKTLRDIDFDIQLHKEKLDKAKSIKQGMMQQLLTGKIRLK